jgi:DNA-binding MarR family transcriptional regulator
VISLNPTTLKGEKMALLLQELEDITDADKVSLGEPLYSILLFVYTENRKRKMPSFKNITKEFDITKTTARKRIYELERRGFIRINNQGRYKFLEVTEKGSSIASSPAVYHGGDDER